MSDVPEGYKMSEVGVIPEEWEVKTLGDCLLKKPEYGINAAAVPYSDNLPVYIRITDISDDGKFLPAGKTSVNNIDSNNFLLEKDDIVFARTGASTGKTYLYSSNDGELVFAGFLIRVKVNPNKLIASYLKSYTETGTYWNWVKIMSMRSGQPGINGNEYAQLQIPLPPLPEQQAIASALSDVDALIAALEQLITKKRNIKQGAMQQLLTGEKRLPGFGGAWEVRRIIQVGEVKRGAGSQCIKYVQNSGVRLIRINDFFDNNPVYVEPTEEIMRFSISKEDILFAGTGASAGASYIPKKEWIGLPHSYNVPRIRLDKSATKEYILYFLQSENIAKQQNALFVGAAQPFLDTKAIANFKIFFPPRPEQQAIAQILSDMDTEIEALKQKRDKYKAIKQGMMQELLTGKRRFA